MFTFFFIVSLRSQAELDIRQLRIFNPYKRLKIFKFYGYTNFAVTLMTFNISANP